MRCKHWLIEIVWKRNQFTYYYLSPARFSSLPRPEPLGGVLPGGLCRRSVFHRAGVRGAGAGEAAGPGDPGLLPAPGPGHGPGGTAGSAGLTGGLALDKMAYSR